MEIQETFTDPEIYSRPMNVKVTGTLNLDTDLLGYRLCGERKGIKTPDRHAFRGAEVIQTDQGCTGGAQTIRGQFTISISENPTIPSIMTVSVMEGLLFLGPAPMTPIGQNRFLFGSNPIEFVKDAQGRVTHFTATLSKASWSDGGCPTASKA